ncbi:MFS transporter [Metabacillus litoralis]|uniref:MFS transporter n=1 Tax=Metabacillus litoralis TaxID=152268 RepID=UPI001CFE7153|nr:MFS transporter [Metabacillus litoralis]
MATLLLIIIYIAFISLGLPDSLLGVAWPVMQPEFNAPLETAGYLFMTIASGTIISSLASGALLKKFGTGIVTSISCLMTAVALLGFNFAPSVIWLIICAIPLGLGAGAIDTGLNNYVALHYKAHHMSWLHCFWGVGATLGPIIMSRYISGGNSWGNGYVTIAAIQFILVIVLFLAMPLWNKVEKNNSKMTLEHQESNHSLDETNTTKQKPLKIKGVKLALLSFMFYCGAEAGIGLWGSTFLVNSKDVQIDVAAQWVSLYYAGITVGRLITGFITLKISSRMLIRIGQIIALSGSVLLVLPFPVSFSLLGFIMIGLGLAPIFPCMIHETPIRFGKENSQTIIGYQMAFAYVGSTFLPPLLGFMAAHLTIGIFPFVIVGFIATMLVSSENLNKLLKGNNLVQSKNETSS